jgi:hypothetical protein
MWIEASPDDGSNLLAMYRLDVGERKEIAMKITKDDGQADEQSGQTDAAAMLLQQFDVVIDLAGQAYTEIETAEKLLEHPNLDRAKIQECLRAAALSMSGPLGIVAYAIRSTAGQINSSLAGPFTIRNRGLGNPCPHFEQ